MSTSRHMLSRMGNAPATVLVAATAVVVLAAAPLPAGAQEQMTAPLLDSSHADRAHRLLEQWLYEGEVPAEVTDAVPITGLVGVRVTLRTAGLTFGAGEAYRSDLHAVVDAHGPEVDLIDLLEPAARDAFDEAVQTLRRMHMAADTDESFDGRAALAAKAPLMLVDLQLAHGLSTVEISRDADLPALFGTFAPGYHGLRIPTPADQEQAVHWPGTVLAANLAPRSQLTHLLVATGHQAEQLHLIAKPDGIPLQRFEAIHLVRPHRDLPVTELVRGNVVLPPRTIDGRTVNDISMRLGEHLLRRFTSQDQVRGTYMPTSDRYDPELANDEDAALACYALVRHAALLAERQGEGEQVTRMFEQARRTAVRLGQTQVTDDEAAHPSVLALTLMTLLDLPKTGSDMALRRELTERLLQFRSSEGGFRQSLADDATPVNQATDALIVAALSSLYARTREPALGEAVSSELSRLWAASQDDLNVAALPWFMLAHDRAATLLADDDMARRRLETRQRGLGDLVDLLAEQQVIESPRLGPNDVIGGFELLPGAPGSPPNPDWRTAQLLTFLALALRDEGITENRDAIGWLLTAGLASRFVGQLILDEPSAYYVRSHADAVGGVRLTLWDNRLAVAPLAMTLLAVTELQETTDQFTP